MKSVAKHSVGRRARGRQLLAVAAAGAGVGLLHRPPVARAAVYVWDAPSIPTGTVGQSATSGADGSGTWNTSTLTWFNASGGTNPMVFGNNGSSDIAVFGSGGTGNYTVTLNGGTQTVKPNGIIFNANSGTYTLSGTAFSLAINKNPFITTNASSATLASSIPAAATGLGTLTFNGSGALTVSAASALSNALVVLGGTGSVNVIGAGALQTNGGGGGLQVGVAAGDTVTYTYAGSTVNNYNASTSTSATNLVIGANGGVGFVNPSNGQFDLLGNNSSGVFVEVGFNAGSGTLLVSGTTGVVVNNNGTVTSSTAAPGLRVGDGGFGTLVVNSTGANASSAGLNALVVARDLIVGGGANLGGTGQVTLINGPALIGGTGAGVQLGAGASSAGTFNIGTEVAGTSTVTVNPNGGPGVMVGSAGVGIMNLNKGTLTLGQTANASAGVPTLIGGAGTGILNLNGGILSASQAGQTLITASPNLTTSVFNGGVTIATGGFNANITAPLRATTGNGVYSTVALAPTPVGGSSLTGLTGIPVVSSITGGTGTGLTAIADVSNGTLTGFEITSPGQGYTAGDTITFTTNGASTAGLTAGQSYTYTLQPTDVAPNTTGGLTKTGAGTLSLSGSSTYLGATQVNGGTLIAIAQRTFTGSALATSSTGTGTVVVNGGGTLAGTGGTGPVVINSGGLITGGNPASNASSAGTLTTGTQTWNAGGGYLAKIDATGANDLLLLSGLNINATNASGGGTPFTVYLNGSSGTPLTTTGLVLASDGSGTVNEFRNAINAMTLVISASNVTTVSGAAIGLKEVDVGGAEQLVAFDTAAAPEPTTIALLGLAATPLLVGRRRNRRLSGQFV